MQEMRQDWAEVLWRKERIKHVKHLENRERVL